MQFTQLDNATVRDSDQPLLVDFDGEGEVVAVCFGAYDSERPPPFEFFGRMKKLEKLTGRRINKVLVRDVSNSWYHYGVRGVGRDVAETIAQLSALVARMRPSRVVAVGQSMGAFGAVLYGTLLDVDAVVAFGPLAFFDSRAAYHASDDRWGDVVRRVEASPPAEFHQDLPRLIASRLGRTRFDVYHGTKATEDPRDKSRLPEACNYDAVHAFLYGRCGGRVAAHPVRWSVHRVAAYLRQVGFIDELLMHRVLGVPYAPEPLDDWPDDPGWLEWMRTNYAMGFDAQVLLPQVRLSHRLTPEAVSSAFNRVRRNVLRTVL